MARTAAQQAAQKKAAAASAAARHKAGPGFDQKLRDRKKATKTELGTALLRKAIRQGPIAGGVHLGNTSTPYPGNAPMPKAKAKALRKGGAKPELRRAARVVRNAAKVHARESFGTTNSQNVKFAASQPKISKATVDAYKARPKRKKGK